MARVFQRGLQGRWSLGKQGEAEKPLALIPKDTKEGRT